MFSSGTSFFIGDDRHLWFIISDLSIDPITGVWVNFTSYDASKSLIDAHHDPACVLMPGDHGYIQHATCVSYAGAHCARISGLKKRKQAHALRLHSEPASPELLDKMRKGAAVSRHLPLECWEFLDDQNLL